MNVSFIVFQKQNHEIVKNYRFFGESNERSDK
jgi:hypothetical protein